MFVIVLGSIPVVFVILRTEGAIEVEQKIDEAIISNIGKWARPKSIVICDTLPKTRSGKIMRRILRQIANGSSDFGETSVIADYDSLNHVVGRFNLKHQSVKHK